MRSNSTSSQIKALSSNSSGQAWIQATLSNGVVLREDFWIGKPPTPTIISTHSLYAPIKISRGTYSYIIEENDAIDNLSYGFMS